MSDDIVERLNSEAWVWSHQAVLAVDLVDGAAEILALRARLAELEAGREWRDIATAAHAEKVLLGWFEETGEWNCIVGRASWGWRNEVANNVSYHGRATHWTSLLPAPPPGGQ